MNPAFEAEAYDLYAKAQRDYIKGGWEPSSWSPSTPAWEAMMAEAAVQKWPLRYRTDLVLIDRQALAEDSSPCIWVLRDYGTHIVRTKTWLSAVAKPSSSAKWYQWDGKSLAPVTYEAAQALAADWPQ